MNALLVEQNVHYAMGSTSLPVLHCKLRAKIKRGCLSEKQEPSREADVLWKPQFVALQNARIP
jgi:hypothetical protein